jgi:CheY-like chemotaxis protein
MSLFGWLKGKAVDPIAITTEDVLVVAQSVVASGVKALFDKEGIRCVSTGEAKVALATLETCLPKAILLQKELDKGNGYSLLNTIRNKPDLRNVPLTFFGLKASVGEFSQHSNLPTRADTYAIGQEGRTLLSQLRKAIGGGKD